MPANKSIYSEWLMRLIDIFQARQKKVPEKTSNPFYFVQVWESYTRVIQRYWKDHPIFFTTKNYIVRSQQKQFPIFLSWLVQWIMRTIILSSRAGHSVPECDVLLVHTTSKPSFKPAMDALTVRLARNGYRCILMNKSWNGKMICQELDRENTDVTETSISFRRLFTRGTGRAQSLGVFLHAIREFFFLFRLLGEDRPLRREIFHKPLNAFVELLKGGYRMQIAGRLLDGMRPKIIITNLAQSKMAAEFHAAKEAKNSFKIWFCNEPAAASSVPAFADEIWVWNQVMVDDYKMHPYFPRDCKSAFKIVGRAEIDHSLQPVGELSKEETAHRKMTAGKPVFLLLSEYVPVVNPEEAIYTRQHIEWVAEASHQCPEWWFVFKPRHGKGAGDEPGLELIEGLPNWIIPQSSIDLRNFLNWENIVVAGSGGSTALLVAAGVGKMAVRLMVPGQSYSYPEMEAVSKGIYSSDELVRVLKDFESVYPAYQQEMQQKWDVYFPYRGQVVERMESLCVEHLERLG